MVASTRIRKLKVANCDLNASQATVLESLEFVKTEASNASIALSADNKSQRLAITLVVEKVVSTICVNASK